ncbi:hypothetical protein TRM7557_03275 [Tritonibacter multivorans]|uniref:Uncharacterized protein n=1 Tax=Tritonibacter multivorans TaxID=928856 RepID=A0A0P1GHR7_9RHOB|nr:hypothetical protein [Tritonibacter multivorans]MDA7420665.1 hypothetical protein [Tritonibacter multivorans]CUH81171.1 hypothetical protein TRM7557_03275 [Tritonibacter multivorans]SFC29932.1 hypothetical protein SAMN04488049_102111 [Tritonibacter multivorans]
MTRTEPRPAPTDQPVSTLGCDPFEEGLLPVVRHLMAGLRGGCSRAPYRAQKIAAERWGEPIGLPAAHYMTNLLAAVLDCRGAGFLVQDPFALDARARVTADEALLLTLIHQMRRDQTPNARETVLHLSGGTMDPHVIRAGLTFAARFPAGSGPARKNTAVPRLQLVG